MLRAGAEGAVGDQLIPLAEGYMKNIPTVIALSLLALSLSCISNPSHGNVEIFNKSQDGKVTLIDQKKERLLVINSNNRIEDVVDLDISSDQVSKIKALKESQDKSTKIRTWPEVTLNGTTYKVKLSTRYYKDKMLYMIDFSPYDEISTYKSATVTIEMKDANGFTLERIIPASWSRVVDEKGIPYAHQSTGEIPMSLDNYLEITDYSPLWRN